MRATGEGAQGGGGRGRRPAGRPPAADRALRRVAAQVRRQAVRRDQSDAGQPVRRVRETLQAEQPGARRGPATARRPGRRRARGHRRRRQRRRRRPTAVRRSDERRVVARRAADVRGRERADVQRVEPIVLRGMFDGGGFETSIGLFLFFIFTGQKHRVQSRAYSRVTTVVYGKDIGTRSRS